MALVVPVGTGAIRANQGTLVIPEAVVQAELKEAVVAMPSLDMLVVSMLDSSEYRDHTVPREVVVEEEAALEGKFLLLWMHISSFPCGLNSEPNHVLRLWLFIRLVKAIWDLGERRLRWWRWRRR